ncbi:MAG: glycosyltransferase [Burkholderiales bacterium]|nr:glycosyltransferase [Burkholderiales bacterium]
MGLILPSLTDSRFWRFAMVGGGFASVNLLMLRVLVGEWHVPYLLACFIAFAVLNFASYRVNKRVTYKLRSRFRGAELIRYYLVMAVSLAVNMVLMYVLVDFVGFNYLCASFSITIGLAFANFFGHLKLTFSDSANAPGHAPTVLMVSAFFPMHGGGIEAVAGQLSEGVGRAGWKVHWMAGGRRCDVPAGDSSSGVEVELAKSVDFLERWLGLPLPIWGWASTVSLWRRVGRADVVHVHDFLYMPTLTAILFAVLRGKPIILTQHIGDISFQSPIPRYVLRILNKTLGRLVLGGVNQVIFVGRPVLDYFSEFVRFRAPPRLVPNGVDHKKYFPVYRASKEAPGQTKILFVGRFVEKKGVALLKTCVSLPDTDWTFIGWGPLSPLTWADRLPSNVRVHENLRSEQLVPYFQQADLLVLPSKGEGFPLVIQEALACGTPVLVSLEVAAAFPSIDPDCVFNVEIRGADAASELRMALAALVRDPIRLASARRAAQDLSLQWSWASCVAEYLGFYQALISRPIEANPD